ncbi:early-responsive to dehydration stress family protein [Salix suchowensis]|nr:early-responsive to dehydration stress family protein [Salix suchowensis]
MDFSSFLTSLGTSFLIFIVLMLLFTWLSRRPGNSVVYYPNRILKGMDPWEGGSRSRNPFAWIREAFSSSEQDVINMSGVDTAVYFVFLSTALGILVLSGLILLPVLLPVAATDDNVKAQKTNGSNQTFSEIDNLLMGNVKDDSPRLWAFLFATYWVSLVTYFLLWKAYMHVSVLRANALMAPGLKPEQFAVLVRDIPPVPEGQTRKEQVDSYFKSIYPETYYRSMVVTNNREVNKIYKKLEGYKKKLAHAEAVYDGSKKTGKPEGLRPTTKTGLLGLVGKKVDSIEHYNEKIKELIPKLEAEQKATLREKQQACAFVFFTNRVAAASAAQSLHAQMVDTWTATEAPEPRQIIWSNLKIKYFQRIIRQYVVSFISIVDIAAVKTVLEAYLPQIALIVFLALLPKLLMALSKAEGIPSVGHAVRATSGKYFYFTVLNVFIGVTLGATLFKTLKSIENKPNSIVSLLASSLPGMFFVGYGLELSRIIPLIIFHLKKKYLCKTEAELKQAWLPGDLGYATRIPGDMLVITIALCYSVIAPLIIPFGVVYFGLGWLVLRNQALKVYVPSFESYGRMWPHINARVIAALILFQVTMFGYFGVKKFSFCILLLIPLPILSLLFAYVCQKKFYRSFADTALEVASRELKEIPNMETVFRSYIPPSLSSEKADDDHFEGALSQASRIGAIA